MERNTEYCYACDVGTDCYVHQEVYLDEFDERLERIMNEYESDNDVPLNDKDIAYAA